MRKIHIDLISKTNLNGVYGCCIPLEIPSEIRLVVYNKNSTDIIQTYLHELGHALAFSSINEKLDVEYKYIYNYIMQEAFAYLLEKTYYKIFDMIEKKLGVFQNENQKILHRFKELYNLRLLAGKYIYQYTFYNNNTCDYLKEVYIDVMEKSIKIKINPDTFLIDANIGNPVAEKFVAIIVSRFLNDIYKEKYGEHWLFSEMGAEAIKKIWSYGSQINPSNINRYTTITSDNIMNLA